MNNLQKYFAKEGFVLDEQRAAKFIRYKDLLLEWNKKINLTAITDEKEVIFKHFIDSLLLKKLEEVPMDDKSLIDVGSGAGFPGLPLAIFHPELKVTLSDSLKKRTDFLSIIVEDLELRNVKIITGRAEDLANDIAYRESFDYAVARAVSKMPILLEYTLPFVKKGGLFFAYKGPDYLLELEEAENALKELGGLIEKVEKLYIQEFSLERNLLLVRKIKNTPGKYPRQAGKPAKKPL